MPYDSGYYDLTSVNPANEFLQPTTGTLSNASAIASDGYS